MADIMQDRCIHRPVNAPDLLDARHDQACLGHFQFISPGWMSVEKPVLFLPRVG